MVSHLIIIFDRLVNSILCDGKGLISREISKNASFSYFSLGDLFSSLLFFLISGRKSKSTVRQRLAKRLGL